MTRMTASSCWRATDLKWAVRAKLNFFRTALEKSTAQHQFLTIPLIRAPLACATGANAMSD